MPESGSATCHAGAGEAAKLKAKKKRGRAAGTHSNKVCSCLIQGRSSNADEAALPLHAVMGMMTMMVKARYGTRWTRLLAAPAVYVQPAA